MRVVTVHSERDTHTRSHTSILAFVYTKEASTATSSMCIYVYLSVRVSLSELGSAIIQAVELVADKESSKFS